MMRVEEESVLISVAAPPLEGRATEEALRALAKALALPPSAVVLHGGARSRQKVFLVLGLGPGETARRLGPPTRP
jgi:uncharacterized protein YggU (UPF0235/DUF167 family)